MTNVRFMKWDCHVAYAQYSNGRTAIQLLAVEDNTPIAVASVNLPDEVLAPDEICIKDYSENEGMLDALVKAGIVSAPIRYVESGYVSVPVCHLMGVMPEVTA